MPDEIPPDSSSHAVLARIHGRVQGVGYRDWTVRAAAAQGLSGWVRNRRDGTVEALFCGPPAAVREMLRACRQGPRLAVVERVDVADAPADMAPPRGFNWQPTA